MSTTISFNSTDPPALPIHRFTVEQYHQLGELGVLTPEDRVELLKGWIVEKRNQRPAHGYVVRLLNDWLLKNLPAGWLAQCQLPITTQRSEPEPDLAVVRGEHADFRDRHPGGKDCRLLIEVADTSLLKDQAKASIYAASGVQEYWIVNLAGKQLERFTGPGGSNYRQSIVLHENDTIETQIGDKALRLPQGKLFAS